MSGNCIGERSGAKLSCKLAYSREGIPKSPFIPTVVVILAACAHLRRGIMPKPYKQTEPSPLHGPDTGITLLSTNKYCHAAVAAVVIDGTGLRS